MISDRLWEADHPYYATPGNYFSNGYHMEYESWADFYDAEGSADPDLNLVYRWDWDVPDPDDYEPFGVELPPESVRVFFVSQRKAIHRSAEFPVSRDDEPMIREWLTERAKTMAAIWAPIGLNPEGGENRG